MERRSVMFLGLRGFPNIQGGVEKHVEELAPRLAKLGWDVTVVTRSPYWRPENCPSYQGLTFKSLWTPRWNGLEAFLHTLFGVLYAAIRRPDIVHIHAIGPAIMTPLARALGLKVVVTHHGPDYDRQKWGRFARKTLQLGELLGMRYANARIVISRTIQELVQRKHQRDSTLIPNSVSPAFRRHDTTHLADFGLTAHQYVLSVGRLVPEKRHLDLMRAFVAAAPPNMKLALVGAADHHTAYVDEVRNYAFNHVNIVLTGFQSGRTLRTLYEHAALFVLPSSHEGLPISLLEALSNGLPVLASDIPANLEVGLPSEQYFPLGDTVKLSQAIRTHAAQPFDQGAAESRRKWVMTRYDGDQVARDTDAVYRRVLASTGVTTPP